MEKTTKVMLGIMAAIGVAGCEDQEALPPKPDDLECRKYEFDYDDGVWECDDKHSSYYHHYYYGGKRYGSITALHNDTSYQNYKKSDTFKKGFGSGTKVSGS